MFAELKRDWELLKGLLPSGWEELARTCGAFVRVREIKDPSTLLWLLFMHCVGGKSLRTVAARARELGIANITDVALFFRLKSSESWLLALVSKMFKLVAEPTALSPRLKGRRIRAYDATTISKPGSKGTDNRLHYSLLLPDLSCDFFELTGIEGGETFTRLKGEVGDIVVADRGLAHREGVAHLVKQQADVIVRLNRTNFPLHGREGKPFEFLPNLRALKGNCPTEWSVRFETKDGTFFGRVCAVRKSEQAAKEARNTLLKQAKKKGKTVAPETLETAAYIFVFTTLPVEDASTEEVLEIYRARWQIELHFKRLKSLLDLGCLEKKDPASTRAWIYAKLLAALMMERLRTKAAISPWGFDSFAPKRLA
jgi:hypothetical protein